MYQLYFINDLKSFKVPDLAELRQISSQKDAQNKCQENKNKNIAAKLVEEYEDYDDDVFIASDLVDTDENLSAALSTFIQWLSEDVDNNNNLDNNSPGQGRNTKNLLSSIFNSIVNHYSRHTPINFNYLLITSDESFVAIDQILPRLASGNPAYFRTKEFRSKFHYFVPVNYHGHNIETAYVSSTYPPIPAEAGSLLSKDLVRFLAVSARSGLLKTFSTVGKSLSIWLAPAGPNYVDDSGWNLDNKSCSIQSIAASPFKDDKSMLKAWGNYLTCGKMCSCE